MSQEAIPAVWMRGGTSKGLFFRPQDLPADPGARDHFFLRALGSPDAYGGQIDGLGGGTSSTSKVCVVGPSKRDDADVDYLFGHVSVRDAVIDYSGNCGNLSAAVAAFAVEQGLCSVPPGAESVRVRIWQQNIDKHIAARVPVTAEGRVEVRGDYRVDGVAQAGARIPVDFLEPGGPAGVLPTGRSVDRLEPVGGVPVDATLIDAGNATVFVRATDFGCTATQSPAELNADPKLLERLEAVRAAAAVRLGLDPTADAATRERPATPKVALVGPAATFTATSGDRVPGETVALCARILSMGRAHHAFTGTGAISLAVAAALPDTLVAEAAGGARDERFRLGHAAGTMELWANLYRQGALWQATEVTLGRSARTLMRGEVLIPAWVHQSANR